jgi:hypothetical protein
MYSAKQLGRNANEGGGLATLDATLDGPRDSSIRHAIDVWESEGGGSAEVRGGFDAVHTALADIIGWRANNSAGWLATPSDEEPSESATALPPIDDEDRILRCLGAAVIMRWNTIPTNLQRELFDNASSVGDLLEAGALKGQIARFLHKHKDDAD